MARPRIVGESFLDAARRELLEETGCTGEFLEIGSHFIAAEHGVTRHVFYAKSCKKVAEPQPDKSERDEGIKVVSVSINQFAEIARSGQMTETAAAFMVLDHIGALTNRPEKASMECNAIRSPSRGV